MLSLLPSLLTTQPSYCLYTRRLHPAHCQQDTTTDLSADCWAFRVHGKVCLVFLPSCPKSVALNVELGRRAGVSELVRLDRGTVPQAR